jgi:hypothetical protein
MIMAAIVGFIFSLPPILTIFGYELRMPTWFLVTITPAWRVFARWFFIIQPLLVFVVAIGLSEYFSRLKADSRKKRHVYTLAVFAVVVLLIEYLPRNPLDASAFWSYEKNLPVTYQFIETLPDSTVLAEFPMREQPYYRGSYYFNGQYIHKKTLFNSYSPVSTQASLRISLMDLSNPQTLPVLRQLGVTHLLVWSNDYQSWTPDEKTKMALLKTERYKASRSGKTDILRIYNIENINKRRYAFQIDRNYRPDDKALHSIATPLADGVTIKVVDICEVSQACNNEKYSEVRGPRAVKADIINTTGKSRHIKVINKETNAVTDIVVPSGESRLSERLPVGVYTIQIDSQFNDRILLRNFEVQ